MRWFWLLALLVGAMGCAGRSSSSDDLTTAAVLSVTPAAEAAGGELEPAVAEGGRLLYRLKSGDRVGITVLTDSDLNSSVEVQPDGRISVPFVGTIAASGRLLGELESEIEDSLGVYLKYPDVALRMDEFGDTRVYVAGEVAIPGAYSVVVGQTDFGSIANAGGLLNTADSREVLLLRRVGDREATVHRVDLQRVLKGADDFSDPIVQNLDIVYVPRTLIGDIGVFVEQFFTRLRPLFTFYLEGWEAFNIDDVRTINVNRFVP
jgi:polysaccharide export outer membrane protein